MRRCSCSSLKEKEKDETKSPVRREKEKKKQKTRRVPKPSQAKPRKSKFNKFFPRAQISPLVCVRTNLPSLPSLTPEKPLAFARKKETMQPHFFHTRLRTGQPVKMPFPRTEIIRCEVL